MPRRSSRKGSRTRRTSRKRSSSKKNKFASRSKARSRKSSRRLSRRKPAAKRSSRRRSSSSRKSSRRRSRKQSGGRLFGKSKEEKEQEKEQEEHFLDYTKICMEGDLDKIGQMFGFMYVNYLNNNIMECEKFQNNLNNIIGILKTYGKNVDFGKIKTLLNHFIRGGNQGKQHNCVHDFKTYDDDDIDKLNITKDMLKFLNKNSSKILS